MPLSALGSNSSHQLSLGHTNDVSTPTLTTLLLPEDERPTKIVAGGNHTLLLTNRGRLFVTGANHHGQCLIDNLEYIVGFKCVAGTWRDCAAIWEGSILIDGKGNIKVFGRVPEMVELKGGSVSGGIQHFMVVTDDNRLLGFGNGRKGQLEVESERDVLQVSCGKEFTCVLSKNGMNVITTSTKHALRSIPPLQNDIKQLTTSWSTISLLHTSGQVTSWGRSDHGQFPPESLPALRSLAAGSEHFLGLSWTNEVFAWGWNEHGNCGVEDLRDVTYLNKLSLPKDEKPTFIAAGCGTSFIWTEKCLPESES